MCFTWQRQKKPKNQGVGSPACVWDFPKEHPASPLHCPFQLDWMCCLPLFVCLAFSRALFGFSEDCFEVTRGAMFHLGISHATQSNIFKVSSPAGTARGCSGCWECVPGWDCCWNKSLKSAELLLLPGGTPAPHQAAQQVWISVCLQELHIRDPHWDLFVQECCEWPVPVLKISLIVFQVLSALLHLGNVQFSNPVDESQPCELQDKTKGEATTMPCSRALLAQCTCPRERIRERKEWREFFPLFN